MVDLQGKDKDAVREIAREELAKLLEPFTKLTLDDRPSEFFKTFLDMAKQLNEKTDEDTN